VSVFLYNWSNPLDRIITIPAPIVSVTVQALYNDIREVEALLANGCYIEHLADGYGKIAYDPGGLRVQVLTVVLRNARVCFEARPGPSWADCEIISGNLVRLNLDDGLYYSPILNQPFINVAYAQATTGAVIPAEGTAAPIYYGTKSRDLLIPLER